MVRIAIESEQRPTEPQTIKIWCHHTRFKEASGRLPLAGWRKKRTHAITNPLKQSVKSILAKISRITAGLRNKKSREERGQIDGIDR